MENFTPVSALAGGSLIGISVSLLLLFNGRIAGITGIMNGAISAAKTERTWRWFFLAGLIGGAFLFQFFLPGFNPVRQHYPLLLLGLGGFLVGFGARMANGCVSGHGICGLARLSVRSLAATAAFMLSGMVTVYVLRHILGVSA